MITDIGGAVYKTVGKDVFIAEPIGHTCPHCQTSYDEWKPGDLTELPAIAVDEQNKEVELLFRAVCESNDRTELVFRILQPGNYFGFLIHYKREAVN